MRLLKLVGKVKELQIIVMGLMNGLSSVTYILLLMLLVFYLFAVMGVGSFQKNDPFHFGSLGVAMVTLFRCATLEDWSDVMYINFYGCDSQAIQVNGNYLGADGGAPFAPGRLAEKAEGAGTMFGYFYHNVCWSPSAQPAFSTLYFIAFTLIAAFVMLSLFIGAVCGGMSDAMDKFKENAEIDKVMKEAREQERMLEIENAEEEARELAMSESPITDNFMGGEMEALTMQDMGDATQLEMNLGGLAKDLVFATEYEGKMERTAASVELFMALKNAREGRTQRYDFEKMVNPYTKAYLRLAVFMEGIATSQWFTNLITVTILAAGVVVGFQTEIAKPGEVPDPGMTAVLDVCDAVILAIFTVDVVVKVIAEGHRPLHYFADSWNCFDFFIVAACFIFMLPFLPDVGSLLAMLRLLRLLRVLKLVKALPQLRIIIEALISGFSSIFFVTIILFIFFYLYANIGMILFGRNDPMHFGNLQLSLLTLFRSATLDDWSDVMYVNIFGCDLWEYSYGRSLGQQAHNFNNVNCNHPEAWGWIGALYMISFVVLGSMVLVTLFIGIVATSMEEAKAAQKKEAKQEVLTSVTAVQLGLQEADAALPAPCLAILKELFNKLDKEGNGSLDRDVLKPLFAVLPLVSAAPRAYQLVAEMEAADNAAVKRLADGMGFMQRLTASTSPPELSRSGSLGDNLDSKLGKISEAAAVAAGTGSLTGSPESGFKTHASYMEDLKRLMEETAASPECLTVEDLDLVLHILDEYYSQVWSFQEFLVVVDFLRRVEENPNVLKALRKCSPFSDADALDGPGGDSNSDDRSVPELSAPRGSKSPPRGMSVDAPPAEGRAPRPNQTPASGLEAGPKPKGPGSATSGSSSESPRSGRNSNGRASRGNVATKDADGGGVAKAKAREAEADAAAKRMQAEIIEAKAAGRASRESSAGQSVSNSGARRPATRSSPGPAPRSNSKQLS